MRRRRSGGEIRSASLVEPADLKLSLRTGFGLWQHPKLLEMPGKQLRPACANPSWLLLGKRPVWDGAWPANSAF